MKQTTNSTTTTGTHLPEPGSYEIDASHSMAEFVARHLMVTKVRGRFVGLSGRITVAEPPEQSSVEVTLDATFDGKFADPWGNSRIGFSATTEIDREDWGLTWNVALESGGVLVSRKIRIDLTVSAVRQ